MAQDKPWLFTVLTELRSTTQLYTSRKSDSDPVKEYRFTLGTVLNWIKANLNLGAIPPPEYRYPKHSGTLIVSANLPTDPAKLHVFRNGILVDLADDENGIDRNGNIWNFHIPLDNETIIIHEYI